MYFSPFSPSSTSRLSSSEGGASFLAFYNLSQYQDRRDEIEQ
jgi:hypothetical protein